MSPLPFSDPPLEDGSLPRQLTGLRSPIILGVLLLIAIEGTLLALFVVSYIYLRLGAGAWPPEGVAPPELLGPTVSQVILIASVVPVWLAFRGLAQGRTRPLRIGLPVGLALACAYLAMTGWAYTGRDYLWNAHAYGSLNWTMSGYAALHVVVVLLIGSVVWALGLQGHFHRGRYTGVQALAFYWLFVAIGSFVFYATQVLSPHL